MRRITTARATALLLAALLPGMLLAQVSPGYARQADGSAPDPRLQMQVRPYVAYAPAPVRIEALVAPATENRQLEFVIDSAWYYRSSTIELSGARAARAHRVVFPSVPAGIHEVRVVLRDDGGEVRATLQHRVTLLD
jgi:hypothetical protein